MRESRAKSTLFHHRCSHAAQRGPLAKFMAALPLATETDLGHGCLLLTLPRDVDGTANFWPGLRSEHLFVRPPFADFYENPLRLNRMLRDASGHFSDTLLRGVPGELWRLARCPAFSSCFLMT